MDLKDASHTYHKEGAGTKQYLMKRSLLGREVCNAGKYAT